MKKVLIAHQSTIPHYRVPFYNALEKLKPDFWCFDVVFDSTDLKVKRFFQEAIDPKSFTFSILEVDTLSIKIARKRFCYQTFWSKAAAYDLIIVESAMNNLAYPLCQFHQLNGTKFAYWGHDKDRSIIKASLPKFISETLKLHLTLKADGFFAYTEGVKLSLAKQGLAPQKIFVINNTIDIDNQRRVFRYFCSRKETTKKQLGLGKKVLLFVGRLSHNKRIDFLLEAFSILHGEDPDFCLLVVGSGREPYIQNELEGVSFLGPIVDLDELGPIYVASDVSVCPGAIGLGPLQAFCYDLPVITIDSSLHGPEIEYLSRENSMVLPSSSTPEDYAQTIIELFYDLEQLNELKTNCWPSIQHLTIEQMARNFIKGVNTILDS